MFKLRQRVAAGALIIGMVLFSVLEAQAAIYFVSSASGNDSNPGTAAQPYQTLKKGLGALSAGDTLLIRGGTYNERLFEEDFRGSGRSWSNFVTVAGFPGESPVIRVLPGGDNAVRFQDGSISHVLIYGLIIDGTGGASNSTLLYTGPASNNLIFLNVEIRNSQGNGVYAEGSALAFIDLNVHHNGLYSGYANSNGMYMLTDSSLISGGEFHDNECYGVRFFDSNYWSSADGNLVMNAHIYRNGSGVGLDGGSQCASGGGGVVLGDSYNVAYNNVIENNNWGLSVFSGYRGAYGTRIYSNTFWGNRFAIEVDRGSTNTDIGNNAIYSNGNDSIYDAGSNTTIW